MLCVSFYFSLETYSLYYTPFCTIDILNVSFSLLIYTPPLPSMNLRQNMQAIMAFTWNHLVIVEHRTDGVFDILYSVYA